MKNTLTMRIHITKDVLKRSMLCEDQVHNQNCAIALAIRDIFPRACVWVSCIAEDDIEIIQLPVEAQKFIRAFDSLSKNPSARLDLPEFSFDIEVPEEVVNSIGLSEVEKILKESKTLELVRG